MFGISSPHMLDILCQLKHHCTSKQEELTLGNHWHGWVLHYYSLSYAANIICGIYQNWSSQKMEQLGMETNQLLSSAYSVKLWEWKREFHKDVAWNKMHHIRNNKCEHKNMLSGGASLPPLNMRGKVGAMRAQWQTHPSCRCVGYYGGGCGSGADIGHYLGYTHIYWADAVSSVMCYFWAHFVWGKSIILGYIC